MSATTRDGYKRVYVRLNLPGARAQRWVDLRDSDPRLEDWLAAGWVSLTGPNGEGPPAAIPRRCCGG